MKSLQPDLSGVESESVRRELASDTHVTREKCISIWNCGIEFDNFSDKEIATAITDLCNHEYIFEPNEIAPL
jgi:hypothetical protein